MSKKETGTEAEVGYQLGSTIASVCVCVSVTPRALSQDFSSCLDHTLWRIMTKVWADLFPEDIWN